MEARKPRWEQQPRRSPLCLGRKTSRNKEITSKSPRRHAGSEVTGGVSGEGRAGGHLQRAAQAWGGGEVVLGAKKSLGRVFGTQAGPADREAPSQPRLSFPLCALGCGSQNLVLVWKPAESAHALSPPCRGCFEVTWSSLLRGGERPARVWGWLCLCSQERKKKKAGNQAAERDPAAFPGSHAFPGLGGSTARHQIARVRPTSS